MRHTVAAALSVAAVAAFGMLLALVVGALDPRQAFLDVLPDVLLGCYITAAFLGFRDAARDADATIDRLLS